MSCREWVTLQHWRQRFAGTSATAAAGSAAGAGACPVASTPAAAGQQKYVCEGVSSPVLAQVPLRIAALLWQPLYLVG